MVRDYANATRLRVTFSFEWVVVSTSTPRSVSERICLRALVLSFLVLAFSALRAAVTCFCITPPQHREYTRSQRWNRSRTSLSLDDVRGLCSGLSLAVCMRYINPSGLLRELSYSKSCVPEIVASACAVFPVTWTLRYRPRPEPIQGLHPARQACICQFVYEIML